MIFFNELSSKDYEFRHDNMIYMIKVKTSLKIASPVIFQTPDRIIPHHVYPVILSINLSCQIVRIEGIHPASTIIAKQIFQGNSGKVLNRLII